MSTWIGIDPGSRYAGVCAVLGRTPLASAVIDRDDDPATYRERTESAVCGMATGARIAIEGITPPNAYHQGKLKLTDPAELIELARFLGWLERAFPGAVVVRPDKNGHRPWAAYPEALMTHRERVNARRRPLTAAGQSSDLRHARSAYDVAMHAARMNRRRSAS